MCGLSFRKRPGNIGLALCLLVGTCVIAGARLLWWGGEGEGGCHTLVITAGYGTDPLLKTPVAPGSEFVLRYTHSQTGGPMELWFTVNPQCRIVLREVRAKVLRPEIEDLAEYAQEVVMKDGLTIYRGMEQVMDPLVIRVRVSEGEQSLVLGGREIPLRSLADGGTRLEIRVR